MGPWSRGGDWTWFCGSLPTFPVLFSPLRASFRGFLHLLGLCHCFSPSAQSWIRGALAGASVPWFLCARPGPHLPCPALRGLPAAHRLQPAQGGLFSLLGQRRSLFFFPAQESRLRDTQCSC